MDKGQFVTLDEVIQSLLVDEGKSSEHDYLRYFNIGLRGLKELSFDVSRNIKTIELELNEVSAVTLPPDYIKYTKIATSDSSGGLHTLGRDTNMTLLTGSTRTTSNSDSIDPPIFSFGLWTRYGEGGGNNINGYYRENFDNKTIEFSDMGAGTTVILEYISDGSTGLSGDEIKIHAFASEALSSYIYWKSIQRKRAINMNEKMLAQKEFYNQKRLARARMQSFTKDEALQTTRKAFKQSPKL